MGTRARSRARPGPKPGRRHSGQFKPGNDGAIGRGGGRPLGSTDVLPRKPVIAMVQLATLMEVQLRNPTTGRLSRSKWAKGVHAAGMRDFLKAHQRALYAAAYLAPQTAAALAGAVTKLGDYWGRYLDNKPPASAAPRVTIFNVAPGAPSGEIPSTPRSLSTAEGPYVDVREDEAP